MSHNKKITHSAQLSRRAFLQYSGAGLAGATLLGLLPDPVSRRAYAQAENKVSEEWLKLASRYGTPTGKFGKIGDPVTLTVGYQPYGTIHWTAVVNKQAQLLQKYLPPGSKIVWFRALSGPLINKNMLAGKNQLGYMSDTPALSAGDKVPCDLISASGYDVGEFGSICVPTALIDEGKVKSPQDLEGQPVYTAFGSFSHRQILSWMEEHKVNPKLESQSIDQQMAALKAGKIYAAVLWEPYPSWLEMQGVAKRWVTGQEMTSTCDLYNPDTPDAEKHSFRDMGATIAIHDWLRDRPDIIAAYVKSEEECRDMLTHQPDLAAYYIWTEISEIPPSVVRATLDMIVWDGRLGPEMMKHLKACARMWKKHGFLTSERTQDPDKYVDQWANGSYLELAMKEMETEGFWTSNRLPGFPKPYREDQKQRHSWEKYKDFMPEESVWEQTRV
jgi:NitT/TauT family transport system substrate-binding protein